MGAEKVPTVDVAGIIVGVTPGILIAIIHTELVLGTHEGGCMGPIVAAVVPSPSAVSSPTFPPIGTFVPVILFVSTPAGATTTLVVWTTDRDDLVVVTVVPPITAATLPLPLTVEGPVTGPTVHFSTKVP